MINCTSSWASRRGCVVCRPHSPADAPKPPSHNRSFSTSHPCTCVWQDRSALPFASTREEHQFVRTSRTIDGVRVFSLSSQAAGFCCYSYLLPEKSPVRNTRRISSVSARFDGSMVCFHGTLSDDRRLLHLDCYQSTGALSARMFEFAHTLLVQT